MPNKAKHPCRYRSCPRLVDSDSGYCDKHQKLIQQQYNQFGRSDEAKKRYGRRWRKLRALFLQAHPLCELCQREGRYVEATEVHHIRPLSMGGTNDFGNLMALCKPCHSRITAASTNQRE